MIVDHLAAPGPGYWDWRCLRCGEDVDQHIGLWRWLWRKLTTLGER
jgi:hypothetical protein